MDEGEDNFIIFYDDRGYALVLLDVFFCKTNFPDAIKVSMKSLEKLMIGNLDGVEFGYDASKVFAEQNVVKTNVYFFEKELCSEDDIDGVLELFYKHKHKNHGFDKLYVIPNMTLNNLDVE